jgi:hypothetical protein
MANLPVRYQSYQVTRYERKTNGTVAVAQASHQAIGTIYKSEITTLATDLTYMNEQIREAMQGGMTRGQAQDLLNEAMRYQQFMSAVSDGAAADIINRQRRF